jgi:hypothetical protein
MGTNRPSAEELEKQNLERQANEQRQAVKHTFAEVRREVRDEMNIGRQIRRRPAAAYGIAAFFSLMMGYKLGRALKS